MNMPYNFLKQIEFTCKRDAYSKAIGFIEQFGAEKAKEFLILKRDGHRALLNENFNTWYDYATQTAVPFDSASPPIEEDSHNGTTKQGE